MVWDISVLLKCYLDQLLLNFYPSLVFGSVLHKKKNTQIVNISCTNQNYAKVSYCNMQNHIPCTRFEQGLERGSPEIPLSLNYSAILCSWIFWH